MLFSDLYLLAKHKLVPFFPALIRLLILAFLVGDFTDGRAQSLNTEQVQYPNSEIAFICGPQLKAGSPLNPAPWFDSTASSMGITLGERFPRIPPFGPMFVNSYSGQWENVIHGRVNVIEGSVIVVGVGTSFTRDVDPSGHAGYDGRLRIRDSLGIERDVRVQSVESDTLLTLTAPWTLPSIGNTVADTYHVDPLYGPNTDHYFSDNYYDVALVQYINFYRTGDTRFRDYARKIADAWWHSQYIADGTLSGGPNHLSPRSMAFAGLMLRALDGRPEMWDYLQREVRAYFDGWVYIRKDYPSLYYDIREDGYAQLYAVMMAKVLPDSYPLYASGTHNASSGTAADGAAKRAAYLSQTEETAVDFFGRLQRPDGSWRWDVDLAPDPANQFRETEQPFMVGLYLESLVLLHQLTAKPSVKVSLVNQLTKAVRHLYDDTYDQSQVTDLPQYRWRGTHYWYGGYVVSNPSNLFEPAPLHGTANRDVGTVRQVRHLNSTSHHAFGYASFVTGDPTYKEIGDEVFDASYGDRVDGIHGLADSGKGKDYAMNYRASGRYLVWRLADVASPNPTPTPTPTATPTPTLTPTPSPLPSASSHTEMIWVEDALPADATPSTHGENWNWVRSSPSSYSGAAASQSLLAAGLHQHYFYGASATMTVNSSEVLIAYVYLDPSTPPSQIMLQWLDNQGSWEHRAYWGSNNITLGTNGTNSCRSMGPLPLVGGWTRLEVPASQVGLEGKTVNGMAFTLYGGRATWDRAGKVAQSSLLGPHIFTLNGTGMGDAVALNVATMTAGEFNVTTRENFGADKQTLLMIFASGLSSGVLNTNTSNDIIFGNSIFPNIAESMVVEARTVDNRIFHLPVEFAGPSGRSYGLDQINVRLIGELRGAGNVELTLIVGGQRSNMATIKLM